MRRIFWIFCLLTVSSIAHAQTPKVGLCLDAMHTSRWQNDSLLFSLKVDWLGGETIAGIANYNHRRQMKQARSMVKQGCQVLVVVSANSEKSPKIVKIAHKKGVKVIAYDRLIPHPELDYYVSFDNVRVGELQGLFVADSIKTGTVALLAGPKVDNNSYVVREGQLNALVDYIADSSIHVVLDQHMKGWRSLDAYDGLDAFYQKHPDIKIDAFIASNDDLALGVYDYLNDHELLTESTLITGQDGSNDALKRILDGTQSMTVYKPLSLTAEAAAVLAMKIAKGEKVDTTKMGKIKNGTGEVPFVKMKPILVDSSNAEKYYR